MEFTDELIRMKKSRKKPKQGDIFIIQPKDSLYFYGKVIRTNIYSNDPMINGMNLVYIYNKPTKEIVMPTFLNLNELLIAPNIVNFTGWSQGYFVTIGNLQVTKEELELKYGFYNVIARKYVNEEGKELNYKPTIWTDYGVGGYGIVANDVKQALKIIT